jgi:isoquinoline 1-oxidoreductase alpha subunit
LCTRHDPGRTTLGDGGVAAAVAKGALLEAQMQGGIMDALAMTLTSSPHLQDGHFLEGSWDHYFYTREWNVSPEVEVHVMPSQQAQPGGAGEFGVSPTCGAVACAYARATGRMPAGFPINHDDPLAFTRSRRSRPSRSRRPTVSTTPTDGPLLPQHTSKLNGKSVTVDVDDDVRLLWVLRDVLGVRGPKYGCGIHVCKACTSHVNGKAFSPCSVPVSRLAETDEVTTIEGLPNTVGQDLHPMQRAWIERDVAQCGYCQPGQVMAAVAVADRARAEGREGASRR